MCPYCDAGPFGVVATHTRRVHGVGKRELRDELGVTYDTPLTSPEDQQRHRESAIARGSMPPRGYESAPRQASRKAKEIWKNRMAQASAVITPEVKKAAATKANQSAKRRAAREAWREQQPHGTRTKYDLGCRCDDCRRAAREARYRYRRAEGDPLYRPVLTESPTCANMSVGADEATHGTNSPSSSGTGGACSALRGPLSTGRVSTA